MGKKTYKLVLVNIIKRNLGGTTEAAERLAVKLITIMEIK